MNQTRRPVAAARRQYSSVFRREVVRLVRENQTPLEDLSRALQLKVRTLQRWLSAEREPSTVDGRWREFAMSSVGLPSTRSGSQATLRRESATGTGRRR